MGRKKGVNTWIKDTWRRPIACGFWEVNPPTVRSWFFTGTSLCASVSLVVKTPDDDS